MGTPIQVLMATAGHLSQKMTEVYTHISQRAMQEAAEKYEERKAELLAAARAKLAWKPQPSSEQVNWGFGAASEHDAKWSRGYPS